MIIVMRPGVSEKEIQEMVKRVEEKGLKTVLLRGTNRNVIAAIGDKREIPHEYWEAFPGVERCVPILAPYKLASREVKPEPSVIEIRGAGLGGKKVGVIAGPCTVESRQQIIEIAQAVKAAGAMALRGGAFKPRTSPYSFQGLGEKGLKILRDVGDKHGMPVVTEIMDPRQVDLVNRYADMFQIGARNMQNFDLLKEVGQIRKPVLLKRGMSATVKDLLMSAEYVLSGGNTQVVVCERGVRSFEDSTRNMLDMSAVPNVKGMSHLPIIVDPSHATGRPDLIPAMARASVAAGADGVHIEVHSCPEKALSDGAQALLPSQYMAVMADMRRLAEVVGKTIS